MKIEKWHQNYFFIGFHAILQLFFSLHKTKVCNKTDCSFVTSYNPPRHAYKRKVCNTDKKKKQNKLKGKIVEKKI